MLVTLMSAPILFADDEPAGQAPMPAGEQPETALDASCPPGVACRDAAWLNVETVTIAAQNGDPLAQYTVAWLTETGQGGMEADAQKANELYAMALPGLKAAAEGGSADACLALATMYAMGKGVEANADMAATYAAHAGKCCTKAPDCCTRAGKCCKGKGGKPDGCRKERGHKGKGAKPACCDKPVKGMPAANGAGDSAAPQGAD